MARFFGFVDFYRRSDDGCMDLKMAREPPNQFGRRSWRGIRKSNRSIFFFLIAHPDLYLKKVLGFKLF